MEALSVHPHNEPQVAPAVETFTPPANREERLAMVQNLASQAYVRYSNDWITFFAHVLGTDGIVRRMFPTAEELAAFEKTPEHAAIQQMVTKLREKGDEDVESREPVRVITVRLPKTLHESLKAEAHLHRTSMNQLCISKLLQLIDNELVPNS
jgi:predicted HicB family RNase H-like nuclease